MARLLFRNLGLALIVWIIWLVLSLPAKFSSAFLVFGGFWVVWFGSVSWRTVATFGDAIEADRSHRPNVELWFLKLILLLLGVMLAQVFLYTLGVFFLEGDEAAGKALFFFLGVVGSTTLLVPAYFWFRSHRWLQPVVAVLVFAGLIVWWEVLWNLRVQGDFRGSATMGITTFALSLMLARPAFAREFNRDRSA